MPKKQPKERFVLFGRGKLVHVVHTKAYDLKNSQCQTVRKQWVAGKVTTGKGLSPEATLALDGCERCGTQAVAKRLLPDEAKRAERKDKRDAVIDRSKGETLSQRARKNRKEAKADKPKKVKVERKPRKTMAGFRSTGGGYEDKTQGKAMEVVEFAQANGWAAKADKDKGWRVTATKDDMVIHVWFAEGKYDLSREAEIIVGNWTGKLRGAHAARRQMDASLTDRDRPHPKPGVGRSGPRAKPQDDEPVEDESPEDARKRVPFSLDDEDIVIIDAVKGMNIRWRNGTSGKVETARVPSSVGKSKRPLISITQHPKTGRRILDFLQVVEVGKDGEIVGGERNVALDKIVRVVEAS